MKSDPQALVFSELGRTLSPYAENDPRYQPSLAEQPDLVAGVEVEQIRDLHARFVGAGHLRVGVVGDFDPDELEQLVDKSFGGWQSEESYERLGQEHFVVAAKSETIDTPDKQMAIVARGASFAMRDDDPDYPVLRFTNYVFGASSSSRLMTALRHEGGLSYGAGSMIQVDDEDAVAQMLAYAMCAPQNTTEAQEVMQAEFARLFESGLSDEEIEGFRQGYLEEHKTQLANDAALVQQMLRDLRTGRNFRYRQKMVDIVNDLDHEALEAAIGRLAELVFVDMIGGDVEKF
jgi:zinc protease